MNTPRVSIIIPTMRYSEYLAECLNHCRLLDYPDYEILVVPDALIGLNKPGVKEIPSGPCTPASKRNVAFAYSTGEVMAFLDDDAFPPVSWLSQSIPYFIDSRVMCVGGPSLTPESDSEMQVASGLVMSSPLATLNVRYRYIPLAPRQVRELPSCNLLVRREAFENIGGFRLELWPGEDSVFCHQIRKLLGGVILYSPQIQVFHHRRALFLPHLSQISRFGTARSLLTRIFPEMVLSPSVFFHPVMFLVVLLSAILCFCAPQFVPVPLIALLFYILCVAITSSRGQSWLQSALVVAGVMATNFTYGFFFLVGLIAPACSRGRLRSQILESSIRHR